MSLPASLSSLPHENAGEAFQVLAPPAVPTLLETHLRKLRTFYEAAPTLPSRGGKFYRRLLAHYYRNLIPPTASVLEIGCGGGHLLSLLPNRDVTGIDLSETQVAAARVRVAHGEFHVMAGEDLQLSRKFDVVVLSETLNYAADVQRILEKVQTVSHSRTRLLLNFHSGLWRPLINLATLCGLRAGHPPCNWLSSTDLRNMLGLAGWEVLKQESRLLVTLPCFGLEKLINRFLAPVLSQLALTVFQIARPVQKSLGRTSVSVIIPARNEAGNIESAVRRMPRLGTRTEIIFVEGNSSDQTWAEIERVKAAYPDLDIETLRQTGRGKGNAVREGFERANGDILMILDADLTMPPEELPKFYDVLVSGRADFANGVRLVYPMEGQAMRFCNFVANKFFGLAFSWALGQPVKDTLCGTKALFKSDYRRIAANRAHFGEFDPFGDFDLLFGSNHLHLKIADIPIRYRDRTYGETNIRRWSHGLLLLRMLSLAVLKIKLV
ncbi:MAG: bifunctional class I SAM-dependent methyltransferase/glycosyltransferase family 2 protein [Verrucomicrobiaceae bacterium]|nr:bifunctional class I SAM-dependent methyltransferase/glycosyltransferase family 2 protein [Verrucomicrobiaceae bacterium]